jgi:SAM-dependent methyltransferase
VANWLVGDRLACVLHLGDSSLAYRLADLGHEVTICSPDARHVQHELIGYVRAGGERLPFVHDAFDAVVVPDLHDAPVALAEYARVLRPSGVVSTVSHAYDDSIPWLRRLREIVGVAPDPVPTADTLAASGLFHDAETETFAAWEKLDLAGLLAFARETMDRSRGEAALDEVHTLFRTYAEHTGFLRLRHSTTAVRARVDKAALPEQAPPPDTLLLDFR